MRVTHSAWRMSSPGSRRSLRRPARSYRSKIAAVSSVEAIVGRDHEVDPGMQVERDLRVDDVGLVPREERHDDLHGA